MTDEQIQQWARDVGMSPPFIYGGTSAIKDFATLVRNAALEEAAVKCESEIEHWFSAISGQDACKDCAKEIRSMKS